MRRWDDTDERELMREELRAEAAGEVEAVELGPCCTWPRFMGGDDCHRPVAGYAADGWARCAMHLADA